jgi:hypothetical protein
VSAPSLWLSSFDEILKCILHATSRPWLQNAFNSLWDNHLELFAGLSALRSACPSFEQQKTKNRTANYFAEYGHSQQHARSAARPEMNRLRPSQIVDIA